MPDYQALVKRLRANLDKYPGFVNLKADAATAIETLLAQQKVLVAEVEAARSWMEMVGAEDHDNAPNCAHENAPKYDDGPGECSECLAWIEWKKARAATDAAFPRGLPK